MPQPFDDIEQKLKGMVQLSVDGMPTIFDSNNVDSDNINNITCKITICYYERSFLLEYWSWIYIRSVTNVSLISIYIKFE